MSPPAAATRAAQPETPERRKARIEGIKKLIQQASSSVRPEAESAAYRACALIRKFGLDVIDPSLLDEVYAENHRLKAALEAAKAGEMDFDLGTPGSPQPSAGAGGFSSWFTQQGAAYGTYSTLRSYTAPTSAQTPPPQQSSPYAAAAGPSGQPMTSPVFIPQSKFAGKCRHCGKVINIGDPVQWMKKVGVWCGVTTCYQTWNAAQKAAAGFNPGIP